MLKAYETLRQQAEPVWRAVARPPRPLVRVPIATCSLAVGGRVNFAATLERSTYRNFPELRLRIVNILL